MVRSLDDPYPVYASVLGRHGVEVDPKRLMQTWTVLAARFHRAAGKFLGRTDVYWRAIHFRVLRELGVHDPDGEIAEEVRQESLNPRHYPPYPEVVAVLHELRSQGLELHIVSNNTENLRAILASLGWESWFRSVSFSQEVGADKPDPKVFEIAVERAGVPANEVRHVGDGWQTDVLGAVRAGLRPVFLDRYGSPAVRGVPTITNLRALLPIVAPAARATA